MFFSEEKNQKTCTSARAERCGTWPESWDTARDKSLLLLFFRKEGLACLTIELHQGRIALTGDCLIEEADALLSILDTSPDAPVDLSRAGHLHAAVFQALLARGARAIEPADDQFVERWLRPHLTGTANV
jgi:hypothetical protein